MVHTFRNATELHHKRTATSGLANLISLTSRDRNALVRPRIIKSSVDALPSGQCGTNTNKSIASSKQSAVQHNTIGDSDPGLGAALPNY